MGNLYHFLQKQGIIEPLELTFPYLTTEKMVLGLGNKYFLPKPSEINLVAPYKLDGLHALSVDKATIFFTPLSIATSTSSLPSILVFMHSRTYSDLGTIFIAAA